MTKEEEKLKKEKIEGWMRIPIGIVSGIIIHVWSWLIGVLFIVNFVYVVITGKKIEELSRMSENWNTQNYYFVRYMTFGSNERPFPFEESKESINDIEY